MGGLGSEARLRRAATVATATALGLVVASLAILTIEVTRGWLPIDQPGAAQLTIAVAVFAISFPVVGWVILRRQPTSLLGWIYMAIGAWQALNMFASAYSTVANFSARLRDEVDIAAVTTDLHATVLRAVNPSSQGLWIREARP